MTERNEWEPAIHDARCGLHSGYPHICTCNRGTRWHGYGERVGDCAGVYGLCMLFQALGDRSSE